jgi:alpha-beta hydrolase superfamily lysophospholipase
MAVESLYRPDFAGDWGAPRTVAGGTYGTDTLTRPDGVSLFFRYWQQPDPQAPALVLLHGLGAHSGWFIDMAGSLNERGLTVYAVDHRGFGRSGGPRGHVRNGAVFIRDIEAFLDEVGRRQPGAPLTVLGHSMGAIFAVYVAANDATSGRNRLAGLILLNPWVQDTTKVKPATVLTILTAGARGSQRTPPGMDDPAESLTELMTTNPEAARMLVADPYWVRQRSASFYFQIAVRLKGQMLRQARRVRAPALVIQADADRSVVPAASRKCYQALGSTDKSWKPLPGFEHDSELEPQRDPLDNEIAGWIARHMA